MPVSTMQCHIEIGIFNGKYKVRFSTTTSQRATCTLFVFFVFFCNLGNHFSFVLLMLLVCGDTEVKPG